MVVLEMYHSSLVLFSLRHEDMWTEVFDLNCELGFQVRKVEGKSRMVEYRPGKDDVPLPGLSFLRARDAFYAGYASTWAIPDTDISGL